MHCTDALNAPATPLLRHRRCKDAGLAPSINLSHHPLKQRAAAAATDARPASRTFTASTRYAHGPVSSVQSMPKICSKLVGKGIGLIRAVQATAMSSNGSHEGMQASATALQGECSSELALRTVTAHGVVPYEAILRAEVDLVFLEQAAVLADSSAGRQPCVHFLQVNTSLSGRYARCPACKLDMEPHPNSACWRRSHAATSQLSMRPGGPARATQSRGLPACAGSEDRSACSPPFFRSIPHLI